MRLSASFIDLHTPNSLNIDIKYKSAVGFANYNLHLAQPKGVTKLKEMQSTFLILMLKILLLIC